MSVTDHSGPIRRVGPAPVCLDPRPYAWPRARCVVLGRVVLLLRLFPPPCHAAAITDAAAGAPACSVSRQTELASVKEPFLSGP
jgi:hypothetical protein